MDKPAGRPNTRPKGAKPPGYWEDKFLAKFEKRPVELPQPVVEDSPEADSKVPSSDAAAKNGLRRRRLIPDTVARLLRKPASTEGAESQCSEGGLSSEPTPDCKRDSPRVPEPATYAIEPAAGRPASAPQRTVHRIGADGIVRRVPVPDSVECAGASTISAVGAAVPAKRRFRYEHEDALYIPEEFEKARLGPPTLIDRVKRLEDRVLPLPRRNTTTAAPVARREGRIRTVVRTERVQVGLDFGTSSTKVAVARGTGVTRTIMALDLGHDLPGCPSFAMPSLAAFDRQGKLLLGVEAAKRIQGVPGHGLYRFKMLAAGRQVASYLDTELDARFREHVAKALGDDAGCTPEQLCATYLAVVMRRIRSIVEHEVTRGRADIVFNTCVPVDQRGSDPVYRAFLRIAAVAQRVEAIGRDQDPVRAWLDRVQEQWVGTEYSAADDATRVFVVPEAVAATAGYLSSLRRETGLHALVDIGSGTTDVSIFNVFSQRNEGLQTRWYGARSIPKGLGWLEELVASSLLERGTKEGQLVGATQMALAGDGIGDAELDGVVARGMRRLWHGTVHAWMEARKKERREGAWRGDQVRVLMAGGGASMRHAHTVFAESPWKNLGPYPVQPVPAPDGLHASARAVFARLCVAAGLTTPVPLLGDYLMPSEVANTPVEQATLNTRDPDKDEGAWSLPRARWV